MTQPVSPVKKPSRRVPALPSLRGECVRLAPDEGRPALGIPLADAPRALDLFCGAGGMSLGFALAGFFVCGGIDADPWAMETHAHYFGGNATPLQLSVNTVEETLHRLGVEHTDVLIGGPPCQGFARVGKGKIRSLLRPNMDDDEVASWDDPRNSLYRAYVRATEVLRPRFLVMENVPDMLRHNGGQVIIDVLDELRRLGYNPQTLLLDASHYGVPQTRQRLFVVANRCDLPIPLPTPTTFNRPITLKHAISDLPSIRPEDSAEVLPYLLVPKYKYARNMRRGLKRSDRFIIYDHIVRQYGADDQEAFQLLEQGGRYVNLPDHLRRYRSDIFDDKYHKLDWNKPSWTITAHIAKDGYKYIHPDSKQIRTITAREAARLQSFPDWFRFAGFRTNRLKQIGNAVPPLLARAIAESIMQQLRERPTPSRFFLSREQWMKRPGGQL